MNADQARDLAAELLEAKAGVKAVRPLTQRFPGFSLGDCFAIRSAYWQLQEESGKEIIGWKVGLTNKPIQDLMGLDDRHFGALFTGYRFEPGATLQRSDLITPALEPEIALVLAKPLTGSSISLDQAAQAVGSMHAALELVDKRVMAIDPETGAASGGLDLVVDNTGASGFCLSDSGKAMAEVSFDVLNTSISINGSVAQNGSTDNVMGTPLASLAWVAEQLSAIGRPLQAGHVVMTGSTTMPVAVDKGQDVQADFDQLGSVGCRFE